MQKKWAKRAKILEKYKLRVTDITDSVVQSGLAGRTDVEVQSEA